MSRSKNFGRKLSCELLETRQMLSVSTGEAPSVELPGEPETTPVAVSLAVDNALGARDRTLAISAIHLLINGREVTVNSFDQPALAQAGESLQVVGIDYRLNGEEVVEGRVAFEGYLGKLRGSNVETDYSDGRFAGHVQEGDIPFGTSTHPGLDGAWTVEEGTERLTLVLVRYGADEVAVEDSVTIRVQVGTPDFVIDPEISVRGSNRGIIVGRSVQIFGAWGNEGTGTFRNYVEVNIYHESDPDTIVWAGAYADVVAADDLENGQFLNRNSDDEFSRRWTPELSGTYTLQFIVDPENSWIESDETNNVGSVQLEVLSERGPRQARVVVLSLTSGAVPVANTTPAETTPTSPTETPVESLPVESEPVERPSVQSAVEQIVSSRGAEGFANIFQQLRDRLNSRNESNTSSTTLARLRSLDAAFSRFFS